MKFIDLRSDTVTEQPIFMKEAMFNAEVGDDVYRDDPTVIKLEKLAAEIVGMDSALFVPSEPLEISLHYSLTAKEVVK